MATPGTLDRYAFRQQRTRSPEAQDVVKSKLKPKAQQKDSGKLKEADLEILKAFDLCYDFGPAIGLTRLERWERAQALGLQPPPNVKQLLQQHTGNPKYTECLWSDSHLLSPLISSN